MRENNAFQGKGEGVDVVCVGQAVVDCITRGIDESSLSMRSARAERLTLSPGGDALNESVVLSRLGLRVRTACITGRDAAGEIIRSVLREAGADVSCVTVSEEIPSVVADIIVSRDGSRRSVNSEAIRLGGLHVDPSVVRGARAVSLASIFRAPLDDPGELLRLALAAKEEGALLLADTKVPVYGDFRPADYAEVLPLIDYIFPNETEAAWFAGEGSFEEMARAFLDAGVGHVVLKAGKAGCLFVSREETFSQAAFETEAVDTTGAGDNFVSGFAAALLDGRSHEEAVRFATACAAVSVRAVGATGGVRSRADVERFLAAAEEKRPEA